VTQPPAKTEEQNFNNKRDHLDSLANDEHVHRYQRERASLTGLGL
jgi:hypothetical protein